MVTFPILSLCLAAISIPDTAAGPSAPMRYELEYRQAGDSMVRVTISLPTLRTGPGYFAIPRAIPMGYGTQPYDRFVSGLEARDAHGKRITLIDVDGPRWLIESSPGSPLAAISYQVNVGRMERQILSGGDASRVRPGFISLLGYSVFGFIEGRHEEPIELVVRFPSAWPVMTTLEPTEQAAGSLSVSARNYYALADAQILGGPDLVVRRVASVVPLTVAVYAEEPLELGAISELADRALRSTTEYFGSAPFPHYTVSLEVLRPVSEDHAYRFSMEHLESATFRFAVGQIDVSPANRDRFYYNLLHHMAHAWIPKRCAPAGYYPFDWDYAAPIDGIWFSEGWAQYAAVDILAAGRDDPAAVRRAWAGRRFDAASVDSAPPLAGRTTAELSRIAARQYSEDFRLSQAVFSRGGRMAEAIDQRMRAETGGARTFRDVVRGLLAWCARADVPVDVDTIDAIIRQQSGIATRDLIDQWLAPRGQAESGRAQP